MNRTLAALFGATLCSPAFLAAKAEAQSTPTVELLRTPDGGIQPQALTDALGTLHLIYFKGRAGAGDLFYVRRPAGQERFSKPIRVNSRAGSAIAVGTVRGGQMALGRKGRIHVAWNSSGNNQTEGMLYARLNDARTAFEDERNLMQKSDTLDGGGTVAADDAGNVYVAWHAVTKGGVKGEMHRRVWLARSIDDGKIFSEESIIGGADTGVCPCCSMHAFADRAGNLDIVYRSATDAVNRDMYRLTSTDHGKTFQSALIHKWKIPG